ncbi:hypothetical protein PHLCEN_2v13050 [Hermanssonia centrifuga]|uniref:Uncharacterized protein n=1 Tax=Hermanssonia centrifuga TaxID=98765 RepID=A0A2R6NFI6_9APHY|nr:hypothetical protein PHLCEN_2v13050 [Hermanssonia centrifuga]
MRILNASEAEMKMADNYYTILSNRVPEVWFDQGIELGGGQPFTVGTEGEERNNRYTLRAAEYLSSIASGGGNEGFALSAPDQLPYVSCSSRGFDTSTTRAVCRSSRCLLETNIVLLPSGLKHVNDTPKNMLAIEARNRDAMGAAGAQFYINHAPLNAVDDRHETYFLSPNHARAGDFIMLDFCDDTHSMRPWRSVMMTWLVDLHTELALKTCVFETSLDGVTWASFGLELACQEVVRDGAHPEPQSDDAVNTGLRQCITVIDSSGSSRYFRVTLMENQGAPWSVHEITVLGRA